MENMENTKETTKVTTNVATNVGTNATVNAGTKAATEKRALPNCAFDMEYQTERYREVKFLAEKGINYTFVRKTRDYGVSQYKYTKTPALFAALVEFYSMLEAEKAFKKRKPAEQRTPETKDDTE